MVPKAPYPPVHHHPALTKSVTASDVQTQLSTFLARTLTEPHLHPDSLLSTSGITFSAHSGPEGGLALHHLRRIEAGLRGENLVKETEEELTEQFSAGDTEAERARLQAGDDARLDEMIERDRRKRKRVEEWAEESSNAGGAAPELDPEEQGQEEFERKQHIVEGEVGERAGAPAVEQNGEAPPVKTSEGREAKRAAKKAKKIEMRRKMAEEKG